MDEWRDLYQQTILEHNKHPQNFGALENATLEKVGLNPGCGDCVRVYLRLEEDVIQDIKFDGQGCAISVASASIMTTLLKGKSEAEARALFTQFHELATADEVTSAELEKLGALAVFAGVHEFPARVKCATLAWHTMHSALNRDQEIVSPE